MNELRFESYYGVADLGDPYLMHHGIKGMKWGVRRYQNKDGTYTQAGLARYRKAEQAYETQKKIRDETYSKYKSGDPKVTFSQFDKEDKKLGDARMKLNDEYTNLKKAYQADKGKELYRRGNTITGVDNRQRIANKVASTTISLAITAAHATGEREIRTMLLKAQRGTPIGLTDIDRLPAPTKASIAVAGATLAAYGAYSANNFRKKKLMRAYWHKSGTVSVIG